MTIVSNSEEILARFRDWLDQADAEGRHLDERAAEDEAVQEAVGLYQLVEQLTALRHDMKLLAKAARGGEERHEATLVSMQAAIEQFRAVQAKEEEAADKAARPLVEAIIDLDEALVRGRSVIQQARQRVLEALNAELAEARQHLDQLYRVQPWWRRWLCRTWHRAARDVYAARWLDTAKSIFDSLLEGYDLIQNRLKRAMDQRGILRMECVGKQADPNAMTVVEVVSDPARWPGTVVEELRPGYYWNGKVFRYAEVKAVGQR